MVINLTKTPNQLIPLVYKNQLYKIYIRQSRGVVFVSVSIEGNYVVASRRVFPGENIFPTEPLSRKYGCLKIVSKYNTSISNFKDYGESINLEFTPPGEE